MVLSKKSLDYLKDPKRRKYASHFEWHDKEIKERGIVQKLFESMEAQEGNRPYVNLRSAKPPHPDCLVEDGGGNTVGFEVTELVSQKAIERNIKAKDDSDTVYRHWTPKEVIEKLEKILRKKDAKVYQNCAVVTLVVYTDEPVILPSSFDPNSETVNPSVYLSALESHVFARTNNISRAFFLFSDDAYVELCIEGVT